MSDLHEPHEDWPETQRAKENRERRERENIAASERKNAALVTPQILGQASGHRYPNMPALVRKSADLT
jgi:hypothetical protein